MARKFKALEAKISPESIARSDARYREIVAEMPLHELRKARGLSQAALAKNLKIKQPNVSKLENRTDMYISTLRSTIEAMGGQLEIVARFPDGDVKIKTFEEIN
jgi:ribosome-binding protein aMBF1 (putative translation factor)